MFAILSNLYSPPCQGNQNRLLWWGIIIFSCLQLPSCFIGIPIIIAVIHWLHSAKSAVLRDWHLAIAFLSSPCTTPQLLLTGTVTWHLLFLLLWRESRCLQEVWGNQKAWRLTAIAQFVSLLLNVTAYTDWQCAKMSKYSSYAQNSCLSVCFVSLCIALYTLLWGGGVEFIIMTSSQPIDIQ